MPISDTLFHFLLDAKGSRLQAIQKATDARLHMNSKEKYVEISGLQTHVEAAKEAIAKAEQEMVDQTVTIPVTDAQLDMLMKLMDVFQNDELMEKFKAVDNYEDYYKLIEEAQLNIEG